MQSAIQFNRATAPTVVLINKSTNRPAWDGNRTTEMVLMCFASIEVAETFHSRIIFGSMKSNFSAKQLTFDEWIETLKEAQREGVEQLWFVLASTVKLSRRVTLASTICRPVWKRTTIATVHGS